MRLLAFLGHVSYVCPVVTAFCMLAFLVFPAAADPASPPISGSNGLMGLWGANSSAPQTDSSRKPIKGSKHQQGITAPGTSTESAPPGAEEGELESSPPSAPRENAPSRGSQSGSNGLIEWNSDSSESQTGNDQQGITDTSTESSPPDAELKSSPPDAELESSPPSAPRDVAPSPSAQSSNGLIEWDANNSAPQTGSSTDLSVAPSPGAQSGPEGPMGEEGTSGSPAGPGSSAHPSGKASKVPNDQQANLERDTLAPDTQTELSPSGAPPEQSLEAAMPPASKVLVIIDKPTQKMKVYVDDVELYSWKVSSGLPGHATPSGDYTASSMNEMWYSKEWDDAPMPHAIFFTKEGHAIHGTEETKKLGRPASHGCVRLAPENARTLFALVKEKGLQNTEIVLHGDTPGGESRVAKTSPRKQQMKRAKTRVNAPPPRFSRRDWFQRRFSGRSQGFYWRY
jgi:lipoprotein-anchoring transpeptidase ErfK/SrfK